LKAVASRYGSKPDWSAFGGHGASLGDVEVVVRFRFQWRLVLDVVNPLWLPRLYASIQPIYTGRAPRSHPPKGVGFPDPLSGTLNGSRDTLDNTPQLGDTSATISAGAQHSSEIGNAHSPAKSDGFGYC